MSKKEEFRKVFNQFMDDINAKTVALISESDMEMYFDDYYEKVCKLLNHTEETYGDFELEIYNYDGGDKRTAAYLEFRIGTFQTMFVLETPSHFVGIFLCEIIPCPSGPRKEL